MHKKERGGLLVPYRAVLLLPRPLWRVFGIYIVLSTLNVSAYHLYGPLLRTFVRCDRGLTAGAKPRALQGEPSVPQWTGSRHCHGGGRRGSGNARVKITHAVVARVLGRGSCIHSRMKMVPRICSFAADGRASH